jgi:hypothetical protein
MHGQIVNDSLKVDSVVIFNVNSAAGTISDPEGYFTIAVKEKDTLVLSSLLFKSRRITVFKADIGNMLLKVKLQAYANELKEVVVSQKLTPDIGNSQAIVDKKYFDDAKSSPKNGYMTTDGSIENGIDFVRMYKDVMKLLRKKNPDKTTFTENIDFTELVMKKIGYHFFSNTLKLKDDQVKLFLVFCENGPKAKMFLDSTQFALMDFLVVKNIEFKKIINGEKE